MSEHSAKVKRVSRPPDGIMDSGLRWHQIAHVALLLAFYVSVGVLVKQLLDPLAAWPSFLKRTGGFLAVWFPPLAFIVGLLLYLTVGSRTRALIMLREWLIAGLYSRPKRLRSINISIFLGAAACIACALLAFALQPLPVRVLAGERLLLKRQWGPYHINRVLMVEQGGELRVGPGVRILFGPSGGILARGLVIAVGSRTQPIYLASTEPGVPWRNLTLWGKGTEGSRVEWVHIQHGGGAPTRNVQGQLQYLEEQHESAVRQGGGILAFEASPTVLHTRIEWCSARYGGGIAIRDGASPILRDCTITRNTAIDLTVSGGGGIWISRANPEIVRSEVSFNEARARSSAGGGIYCGFASRPTLIENRIVGNFVEGDGGGIYSRDYAESVVRFEIRNNEIARNVAQQFGGGICLDAGASPDIIGNSILENRTIGFRNLWEEQLTSAGGGIFIGGEPQNPRLARPVIVNNRILGNIAFPVSAALRHLNGTGGGIAIFGWTDVILNGNLVAHNLAGAGGGIYRTQDSRVLDQNGLKVERNKPDDWHDEPIRLLPERP